MVGAEGFEPPTSCSQSRRATRLRHAPTARLIVEGAATAPDPLVEAQPDTPRVEEFARRLQQRDDRQAVADRFL